MDSPAAFTPAPLAAPALGPAFDSAVPPGGYLWWYVDAISDDGHYGLTLILFVGSVFSPYYAWSGRPDPADHCALNVALYGRDRRRWAMTERGRADVIREATQYQVGPSHVGWVGDSLVITVNEWAFPLLRPMRGTIRVTPQFLTGQKVLLDPHGHHVWQPIAPCARVELAFSAPDLRWSGDGYLDSNYGAESLEDGFQQWDWSRAHDGDDCVVFYDSQLRRGGHSGLAARISGAAGIEPMPAPPRAALRTSGWRVPRATRADAGGQASVHSTLEDTPFYARSMVKTQVGQRELLAMHESLDLDRFQSPWVRMLLPFRMPRVTGRGPGPLPA